MKGFFRTSIAFFVVLTLLSGLSSAQTRVTGSIQGKVTDEKGVALPGASVMVKSPNLMGSRSLSSDMEGKYRFLALPSGTYEIEASLQGFAPARLTGVGVHANATSTVDIVLAVSQIAEEIVVIGEAPLIDVMDSSVGKTFFGKEILEKLPSARDTFRLVNQAPGVTYLSAYGSGDHTGNLYQLDGVEIVDSWFGGGIYSAAIDYDIIEETQFIALGAPAEFGNFTGVTINIVTKSGGNKLSGDVHFYVKGKSWQSSNVDNTKPEWSLLTETPLVSSYDVGFHLGGPIIKDKLWFFGGFNYLKSTIELESLGMSRPLLFPKGFFKLTYQPDQKNRFSAFAEYHKSTEKNMTLSPLVPEEANYQFIYPVWIGNISWLHTISPRTILETKFAFNDMLNDYIPNSGRDVAGHYDYITGESSVNSTWWGHWISRRYALNVALSHSVDRFIQGSHDLKLGVEVEKATGGGTSDVTGDLSYYDLDGAPYRAESWGFKSWGVNWRYTGYAQDDWKLSDSIVINPGLRFSVIRGSIPDLGQTVYKPTNVEPRIGFVVDLNKSHTTVVKAHYGRYFEGSKSYYFSNLQPHADTVGYEVNPDWSLGDEIYRISGQSSYSIDPHIKHPSMDQAVVGLERIIGKEITVGISGIYRYWKNFIEPVNLNALFETQVYVDPETDRSFTVYNRLNPSDNDYYITNPVAGRDYGQAYDDIVQLTPYRKYRGLQFSFNKRFSHRWQLSASYVLSKEDGTYGNSHAGDVQRSWMGHQSWNMAGSSLYLDPTNQINLMGHSLISSPHVVKVFASYLLPSDIGLSVFYVYSGGRRWERNVLLSSLTQGPYLMTEPRGSRSLPAQNNLDVRMEKSFHLRDLRFSVMVDAFNLFNQSRMIQVMDVVGPNFGKGLNVNSPRTLRASFGFYF